jgi:hypothetical protein
MFMLSFEIKKTQFLIFAVVSLLMGFIIYILFRPETYVTKWVVSVIGSEFSIYVPPAFDNNFIKYYLPDYLWGLSLACGLHLIFLPKRKGSIAIALAVTFIGVLYEIMQYINLIIGTGDVLDVLLYLLAGFTAFLLNFRKERN